MSIRRRAVICLAVLPLGACTSPKTGLMQGSAAQSAFPAPSAEQAIRNYRVGALDVIAVSVFQESDLTAKDIQVDAAGNVLLPLIGSVHAAGLTTTELSEQIAARLKAKFLQDPQVTVIVQESVSQKVTVEGSVTEPGVYQIRGRTTLLDALAMAKGPSRVASLSDVVIFREIDGRQMGALFNVATIRRGGATNPEILGNDTVVVGLSNVKAAWRDILTAAPLVAVFRPFN